MIVQELPRATQIRLPKIKLGLLQKKTREEIGVICHVSEITILRDIKKWTRTDDFPEWIKEVWLDLYTKVDNLEAFRQATRILVKSLTTRIEAKAEITEKKVIEVDVTEDEDKILSLAAKILERKTRSKKIH